MIGSVKTPTMSEMLFSAVFGVFTFHPLFITSNGRAWIPHPPEVTTYQSFGFIGMISTLGLFWLRNAIGEVSPVHEMVTIPCLPVR